MFNSLLNKSTSDIENGNKVALDIRLKIIGDCNNETNFSHKLIFTKSVNKSLLTYKSLW